MPIKAPQRRKRRMMTVASIAAAAVSLTGAAQRRLPYDSVPADYGGLREQLELDQIVETREAKWQNGNVGRSITSVHAPESWRRAFRRVS